MLYVSDKLLSQMVDDDYTAWESILTKKQISANFLILLDKANFDSSELKLVRSVLPIDLTEKQLYTFFNSNFSIAQLKQICICLKKGMPIQQIETIANPAFSAIQMECLIFVFNRELDIADIEKFSQLPGECMQLICEHMLEPYYFSKNKISLLINSNIHSKDELAKLCSYICNAVPAEIICNPELSPEQRAVIASAFGKGLSKEAVTLFANPTFTVEQMNKISHLLLAGYPLEDIKVIAKPALSCAHIDELIRGYDLKLTPEQISTITFTDFTPEAIRGTVNAFHKANQVIALRDLVDNAFA